MRGPLWQGPTAERINPQQDRKTQVDGIAMNQVFTIEIKGSKGWEVIATYNEIEVAIRRYREELRIVPIMAVRLTSPTDLTIYD